MQIGRLRWVGQGNHGLGASGDGVSRGKGVGGAV